MPSLRHQIAAYAKHSKYDAVAGTAAARAASPSSDNYWLSKVDPDGTLDVADRQRRASAAKKEHYARLALASVEARRKAS